MDLNLSLSMLGSIISFSHVLGTLPLDIYTGRYLVLDDEVLSDYEGRMCANSQRDLHGVSRSVGSRRLDAGEETFSQPGLVVRIFNGLRRHLHRCILPLYCVGMIS